MIRSNRQQNVMAKTKGTYVSVSPLFFYEQIGILFVFERRQNMQIKKDYTREQIVRVAKRVFLRKGFAKASMRDVTNGGIYNRLSADYALNDQLHATLGYDFFHADRGSFTVYDNNSEVFLKLKYSF